MGKMIGMASDHAAYDLKEFILGWLTSKGFEVVDYGCMSEESVDYADFGHALARGIESGEVERGVAMCGSGIGMSMTLNRHKGVRASLCWRADIAAVTRAHNDSNVVVLPARFITNDEALQIVSAWLESEFEGGRHARRIEKIEEL